MRGWTPSSRSSSAAQSSSSHAARGVHAAALQEALDQTPVGLGERRGGVLPEPVLAAGRPRRRVALEQGRGEALHEDRAEQLPRGGRSRLAPSTSTCAPSGRSSSAKRSAPEPEASSGVRRPRPGTGAMTATSAKSAPAPSTVAATLALQLRAAGVQVGVDRAGPQRGRSRTRRGPRRGGRRQAEDELGAANRIRRVLRELDAGDLARRSRVEGADGAAGGDEVARDLRARLADPDDRDAPLDGGLAHVPMRSVRVGDGDGAWTVARSRRAQRVDHVGEVVADGLLRGVRVAAGDGVDDRAMLQERLLRAPRHQDRPKLEADELGVQQRDQP